MEPGSGWQKWVALGSIVATLIGALALWARTEADDRYNALRYEMSTVKDISWDNRTELKELRAEVRLIARAVDAR